MYSPGGPPTVIDIEASGLDAEAYPIEIGVALPSGETFCALIRPEPDWQFWDDNAEKVHRVPRDILELYGRPIDEIVVELNRTYPGSPCHAVRSNRPCVRRLHKGRLAPWVTS